MDNELTTLDRPTPEKELSMTTVYRDDLIRLQVLRRKCNRENSQSMIEFALNYLEANIDDVIEVAR